MHTPNLSRRVLFLFLTLQAMGLAACGSSGSSDGGFSTPDNAATPIPDTGAGDLAAADRGGGGDRLQPPDADIADAGDVPAADSGGGEGDSGGVDARDSGDEEQRPDDIGPPMCECPHPPPPRCEDGKTLVSISVRGCKGNLCDMVTERMVCAFRCERDSCLDPPPDGGTADGDGAGDAAVPDSGAQDAGLADSGPVCPRDKACGPRQCGPDPVCGLGCGACDKPPARECLDASRVRDHQPIGVCGASGQCEYEPRVIICSKDCQNGVCLETLCGNGRKDGAESCDGDAIECSKLNNAFVSGSAKCKPGCDGYDDSACVRAVTYTSDIQPIMTNRCIGCHGARTAGGAPGNFRLDRYNSDGFRNGVFEMRARVKVRAVDQGTMPPGGGGFTAKEKETFIQWMNAGAPE
ncbi:MAG: hypothetical protein GMKNLPBB_02640 [Myxococcota bacterium]|nr:hypothetical protein [Myxococcota bacterium]